MPEFMGHKITRAEEKARHAFRRDLDRAIRQSARRSGWKSSQGVLFQDRDGWFVEVMPSVMIFWRETRVTLKVKPMGIDPIFWELVDTPENNGSALSFRAFGAWTCSPVELSSASIEEGEMDAAATASRIVAWATREIAMAANGLSLESFIENVRSSRGQADRGALVATLVSTLLLAGRTEDAERACGDAVERGWSGGFGMPDGTFPEVALKRLELQRTARVVH